MMGTSLAVPASAAAWVTIGSNLGSPLDAPSPCSDPCTIASTELPFDRQAPGGLASPVNGTAVSVRFMAVADAPVRFRVLRPHGGGSYAAVATSQTVMAYSGYPDYWDTFFVSLPIRRGDLIGIDCCTNPAESYFSTGPATSAFWEPSLPFQAAPPTGEDGVETLLQADIQPNYSFEIREVHARKGGNVEVVALFPNHGTLTVTGHGSRRGRPPKTYLVPATFDVPEAVPTTFSLSSTRVARRTLKAKKRAKALLDLAYIPVYADRTPGGFRSQTQRVSVRLKR
jgi:hypothetical protein